MGRRIGTATSTASVEGLQGRGGGVVWIAVTTMAASVGVSRGRGSGGGGAAVMVVVGC